MRPIALPWLIAAACTFAAASATAEPVHHVEEEWLVAEIASAIAGDRVVTTRLAAAPGPIVQESFDLVMPDGRHHTLTVAEHVWAPANYIELARASTKAIGQSGAPETTEWLAALTTPRIEVLLEANVGIARALAADRPGAHDDAALLLAAFAFREAAGPFSDTRPAMCAITAHLAIARARGDAAGPSGRAAEIALLVLAGREQDALRRLGEWEQSAAKDSPERSWITTLRLRATGDWRTLKEPAHASLLERLAYVRAIIERLGANRAMDFLEESHPEDVADWTRLMTSGGMTVEAANIMTMPAVAEELNEAQLVLGAVRPARASGTELDVLVAALNETGPPARGAVPIAWPMFAASYHRHLAMALAAAVKHLNRSLGVTDGARELAAGAEKSLGGLTLYPLAKRYYAIDEAQYWEAMKGAAALVLERPELVTSANWTMLSERWSSAQAPGNIPVAQGWFRPLTPFGTAYDAGHRIYTVRRSLIMLPAELDRVRSLAPSVTAALFELPRLRPAGKPPLARLQAEAGALADYDLAVMRWLAAAAEPDAAVYRPLGRRMCELDASECEELAAYLADRDLDEEAAAVYQEFADRARDRVMVSREIGWLVFYYEQRGQPARAAALADQAADVYSYLGLTTKARLLERRGQYDEAEQLFQAARERYPREPVDLASFYLRRAQGASAARYRERAEPLVKQLFPRGFEPFGTSAPGAAPEKGVRISRTGARGAAAGLQIGDIIVAVDGITVRTRDQMDLVWRMREDAAITFVVWRGDRHVTVQSPLRFTWASGTFASYDYRWPILS